MAADREGKDENAFWTNGENDFTEWNEAAESDELQEQDEHLEEVIACERRH